MKNGFLREGELRRWLFLTSILMLILTAVALEIGMEGACWDEKIFADANISEATNCLDYWASRYQGMIGAVVSVCAAVYAGYWVKLQIDKTQHQIELSAKQFAIQAIPNAEFRYHNLIEAKTNSSTIVGIINRVTREIEQCKKKIAEACGGMQTHNALTIQDCIEKCKKDIISLVPSYEIIQKTLKVVVYDRNVNEEFKTFIAFSDANIKSIKNFVTAFDAGRITDEEILTREFISKSEIFIRDAGDIERRHSVKFFSIDHSIEEHRTLIRNLHAVAYVTFDRL